MGIDILKPKPKQEESGGSLSGKLGTVGGIVGAIGGTLSGAGPTTGYAVGSQVGSTVGGVADMSKGKEQSGPSASGISTGAMKRRLSSRG